MRGKFLFILIFAAFLISGCGNRDIKDNYCGIHINFMYCKCAFHNEFCDAIGMKSGEAKKYVYEEYEKWLSGEESEEYAEEEEGECKYDSDCDPICEGATVWKMGCNARTNTCEKTFDTDCSLELESFGTLDFPKTCEKGVCARDEQAISTARENLLKNKQTWSDAVKEINAVRPEISQAMLDANKNCLSGLADMTNVAIIEFATRVGSILAGGLPDIAKMTASAADAASGLFADSVKNLAGAAVDYAGFAVEKLKAYEQGEPADADKKLAPHEFIKLNCDLYEYFKGVQAESDTDLATALEKAAEADSLLRLLPR